MATCLGTPVIALTGLKMGMFAAMGGGIMGFATGKMFAEHEYEDEETNGNVLTLFYPGRTRRLLWDMITTLPHKQRRRKL